jgi:hypothetical protein
VHQVHAQVACLGGRQLHKQVLLCIHKCSQRAGSLAGALQLHTSPVIHAVLLLKYVMTRLTFLRRKLCGLATLPMMSGLMRSVPVLLQSSPSVTRSLLSLLPRVCLPSAVCACMHACVCVCVCMHARCDAFVRAIAHLVLPNTCWLPDRLVLGLYSLPCAVSLKFARFERSIRRQRQYMHGTTRY